MSGGSRGLDQLKVLPYRAGYEEGDRQAIQERLTRGDLRGVISTSALELGLDISGVNSAVLVGVPNSATSFTQRIGRVGRQGPGDVYVIHAGGVQDDIVFRDPDQLLTRPLTQSALNLENRRVQYIHALCFAGAGAEYDTLQGRQAITANDLAISSRISWPEGFLDLGRKERLGEIPVDLQSMKVDSGDDPWRAVYYYLTRPYRVTRVLLQEKKVVVRHEKQYTTDPSSPPPIVAPSLAGEGLHGAYRFSDLSMVECDLWVKEAVLGFTERNGSHAEQVKYPSPYYNHPADPRRTAPAHNSATLPASSPTAGPRSQRTFPITRPAVCAR